METEDAYKFAAQMDIQLFETSAKENLNVEEVCTCSASTMLVLHLVCLLWLGLGGRALENTRELAVSRGSVYSIYYRLRTKDPYSVYQALCKRPLSNLSAFDGIRQSWGSFVAFPDRIAQYREVARWWFF